MAHDQNIGLTAPALTAIVIAYGPFFLMYTPQAVSPGFKLF